MQKLNVLTIHWGWITPGVPQCNRELQIPRYFAFLDRWSEPGSRFCFTQPGWLFDLNLAPAALAFLASVARPRRE